MGGVKGQKLLKSANDRNFCCDLRKIDNSSWNDENSHFQMETAKISNVAIYLIAELAKKSPNMACARGFERARNFKINKVNQDFSFSYKEILSFPNPKEEMQMHRGRPDRYDLDKVLNEDLFWRRHLAKDGKTGKDFETPRNLHFKVLKTIY